MAMHTGWCCKGGRRTFYLFFGGRPFVDGLVVHNLLALCHSRLFGLRRRVCGLYRPVCLSVGSLSLFLLWCDVTCFGCVTVPPFSFHAPLLSYPIRWLQNSTLRSGRRCLSPSPLPPLNLITARYRCTTTTPLCLCSISVSSVSSWLYAKPHDLVAPCGFHPPSLI